MTLLSLSLKLVILWLSYCWSVLRSGYMGSLQDGTLCFYCGIHEAGYNPNCCSGCYDRALNLGWNVIVQERLMCLWEMEIAMICTDRIALPGPLPILEVQRCISSYL